MSKSAQTITALELIPNELLKQCEVEEEVRRILGGMKPEELGTGNILFLCNLLEEDATKERRALARSIRKQTSNIAPEKPLFPTLRTVELRCSLTNESMFEQKGARAVLCCVAGYKYAPGFELLTTEDWLPGTVVSTKSHLITADILVQFPEKISNNRAWLMGYGLKFPEGSARIIPSMDVDEILGKPDFARVYFALADYPMDTKAHILPTLGL